MKNHKLSTLNFRLLFLLLIFIETLSNNVNAQACTPMSVFNHPTETLFRFNSTTGSGSCVMPNGVTMTYNHVGTGVSDTNYGCSPYDPTYWVYSGTMTVTFSQPVNNVGFLVWGLDGGDDATVLVNGAVPTSMSLMYKDLCPGQGGSFGGNVSVVGNHIVGAKIYPGQAGVNISNSTSFTTMTISLPSSSGYGLLGIRMAVATVTGNTNICVGNTTQLTGSGTPAATNPWVSSNTAVATVSSTGLVTGVSAGTAIITYTDSSGLQGFATITVGATITGTTTLNIGATTQLTGSGTAAATNPWVSSNTAVVTVSSTGLVTGVSAGTATITYTNNIGCPVTATIIVLAKDSDGDGVTDDIDLDDDNDGILDTVECNSFCSDLFSNGSFETPTQSPNTYGLYNQFTNTGISWQTTATDNLIELWSNPFNGVTAAAGNQFAELNATQNAALYQTFCLNGTGGTINWSVKHRGRSGTDVAVVEFGPTIASAIASTPVQTMTDSNTTWGSYSGTYTIPVGQTSIVIAFEAISSAGGDPSYGNFIDDVRIQINQSCIDTDGDGIPNSLDLDSDNDGCLDAIEGDENVTTSQLVTAGGTVTVGTGSTASNQNLCAGSACVDAQGVPIVVNSGGAADIGADQGQGIGSSEDASVNACKCYKAAATGGTVLDTKHGITALGRAGANNGNWPMVRKGAWTALEAKSKGFVVNRVANTANLSAITNPIEGMMVYDEEADCLKIYTKDNVPATTYSWRCFGTQTCPDVL